MSDEQKISGDAEYYQLSDDGQTIYYFKNYEEKEETGSLYRFRQGESEAEKISSNAFIWGTWGIYLSSLELSDDGLTVYYLEQVSEIPDTYSDSGNLMCATAGSDPVRIATDVLAYSLNSGLRSGNIDPKSFLLEKYISVDGEENIAVNWIYFDGSETQTLAKEVYHTYNGKTTVAEAAESE